jgi:glycosyltransferase involved in cell wall biosynthesis
MKRVCIQWPRFGPYHLARLRATHRLFQERGVEVVGLETAGNDATYAWDVEQDEEPFRRVQVFPNRVFETIPPAEVHDAVTATLDRLDPDAVAIVSYSFPDARACLTWCRRRRRVAVLMSATKENDAERVGWRERIKALLVRQYDAALVGGTPQRAYLEKLGFPAERIFQPYNAVDNDFFYAGAEAARREPKGVAHLPGLEQGGPFFLASGRFLAIKNLDRLLLAYNSYRSRVPTPWPLLLLGDGPERPHLEQRIRHEHIEGVTLCGFQQREALPAYYGLAGAFVHPTLKDTWGLVVNEAMAAGLPVLVSERAGCAGDLVEEGTNGFTFDPDDTAVLTTLLEQVAAPSTDRETLGTRAREIVAAWSPERFAEGLWAAVWAGDDRPRRVPDFLPRAVLWGLRHAARRTTAFHSVQD